MSADIIEFDDGLLTARIAGRLTQSELSALQRATAELIEKEGNVRLLIELTSFKGWNREDWADLSFQVDHDAHIEKMAIVGERKWKDLALVFAAQGIRKFPIEYFETSEKTKALDWLAKKETQDATR